MLFNSYTLPTLSFTIPSCNRAYVPRYFRKVNRNPRSITRAKKRRSLRKKKEKRSKQIWECKDLRSLVQMKIGYLLFRCFIFLNKSLLLVTTKHCIQHISYIFLDILKYTFHNFSFQNISIHNIQLVI